MYERVKNRVVVHHCKKNFCYWRLLCLDEMPPALAVCKHTIVCEFFMNSCMELVIASKLCTTTTTTKKAWSFSHLPILCVVMVSTCCGTTCSKRNCVHSVLGVWRGSFADAGSRWASQYCPYRFCCAYEFHVLGGTHVPFCKIFKLLPVAICVQELDVGYTKCLSDCGYELTV